MGLIHVSECILCSAVKDAGNPNGSHRIHNTPIAETNRFIVMPCIGPLIPGHVLVVSRDHSPSLASLGSEAIDEYEKLLTRFKHSHAGTIKDLLEAEHGSAPNDCGGACVVHAHVHWLPGLGRFESVFEGVLDRVALASELTQLVEVEGPYLLVRHSGGRPRVYDGEGLTSQLLRQAICTQLGREDWDWRSDPKSEWIASGLEMWSCTDENEHSARS